MADPFQVLTVGILSQISDDHNPDYPVLQCVQVKPMAPNEQGQNRWRMVFSDTVNFIQGMLAIQANHHVEEGKLQKGSICRLLQYQTNIVKNKHIVVVIDLEVLEEYGQPGKLGKPESLDEKKDEDVTPQQPGNISGHNFYGNRPQQPQQQIQKPQQQSLPSRMSGSSHGGPHGMITPIEAISPYSHKWTMKARCTHKGEIKTWHNKNGEGKLFSANFLDESGEIRATGFNDQVDAFYDILQEGGVYYISTPAKVNMAKKQFSNLNNDYEITFEKDTQVEKAEDNDGVPQVRFNFTTLAALQSIEKDATVDVIGVLSNVEEVSQITSKTTGKPYFKRELTLVDDTGYNVRLTVWGNSAQSFDAQPESVLAFKGVKVSDFNGRSLSLLSSGTMAIDPDIEEAFKLKGWYDGAGRMETFTSHASTMPTTATGGRGSDTKTIAQIRDENLGMGAEADWFSLKATIVYIKNDNFAYPSCRTKDPKPCNKKVNEEEVGKWRCEKCQVFWDKPDYRYIMSLNVSDHTGQIWLSGFNDTGDKVMGLTANELTQIKEEGDEKRFNEVFEAANCRTYNFRCQAKMDTFQDQQRVRYQVQHVNAIDFKQEAKKLADMIKLYNIQEENSLFVS